MGNTKNGALTFFTNILIVSALVIPPIVAMVYSYNTESLIWLNLLSYNVLIIESITLIAIVLRATIQTIIHSWKYSQHKVKIKKGKHFDFWYSVTRIWWTNKTKSKFRVKFNKEKASYVGKAEFFTYFSESWNKLGGICCFTTHYLSDRNGFRYNPRTGTMELCDYVYLPEKGRHISNIRTIEWDQWVEIESDLEKVLGRDLKWYERMFCFKNNPMFGGKYPAPNDIEFEYQKL